LDLNHRHQLSYNLIELACSGLSFAMNVNIREVQKFLEHCDNGRRKRWWFEIPDNSSVYRGIGDAVCWLQYVGQKNEEDKEELWIYVYYLDNRLAGYI
jgi:hypothetical protein